jgi:hypothetical protein
VTFDNAAKEKDGAPWLKSDGIGFINAEQTGAQLLSSARTRPLSRWFSDPQQAQMEFRLEQKDDDSNARAGIITTERGEVRTPVFMPVGTQATVCTSS